MPFQDPQSLKPSAAPPPLSSESAEKEENPFAIARPHAKVDPLALSSSGAAAASNMFQRQTSFRGFNELQVGRRPH